MPISKKTQDEPKKKKKRRVDNANLIDFLETTFYKRLNKTREAELITVEDNAIQLLRVAGTGASSVSYEEQRQILSYFYTFLSKNTEHMTFEITKLPVSTKSQVLNLRKKLATISKIIETDERKIIQLEIIKGMLRKKIEKQKELENRLDNIEYILYLYALTPKELKETVARIMRLAWDYRLQLYTLTPKEKEQILFQLNNLNTKL